MKTKISLLILMLAGVYFNTSCKAPDTVEISIYKETDSLIHVNLYPKAEYRSGKEYRASDVGSWYRPSEYDLSTNKEGYYRLDEVIFSSHDLDVKPYTLVKEVFDSICIHTANATLKFTHDTVIGYSENLFTENSTWNLKITEDNHKNKMSSRHNVNYYIFLISEDKITIEKEASYENKN